MFIDELKDYIEDNTTLVYGSTLFVGKLPDSIGNCVAIQLVNTDNYYNMNDVLGHYAVDIAIRVRGSQTEGATRTIANDLQGVLENISVSLPNYRIVRGAFETPMYQLDGTDANNNYIYVGLYRCLIEDIYQ